MEDRPSWAPPAVDIRQPSAARVYDYFLGGSHNFASDRAVAEQALMVKPDLPDVMRENRAFLRRAVRYMVDAGITQFLDIGSGIPTVGNVHEVVHSIDPTARVVYVDHDPIAVAHAGRLLAGQERVVAVSGDLRDPDAILADPEVARLIDLDQPLGLLLVAVLHFVFDRDQPQAAVKRLRGVLAPGSYLAIEHATHDWIPEEGRKLLDVWNANAPEPMQWRSREEITAFFEDLDLLDPGVVNVHLWRPDALHTPDPNPERFAAYAAVGRKP